MDLLNGLENSVEVKENSATTRVIKLSGKVNALIDTRTGKVIRMVTITKKKKHSPRKDEETLI